MTNFFVIWAAVMLWRDTGGFSPQLYHWSNHKEVRQLLGIFPWTSVQTHYDNGRKFIFRFFQSFKDPQSAQISHENLPPE